MEGVAQDLAVHLAAVELAEVGDLPKGGGLGGGAHAWGNTIYSLADRGNLMVDWGRMGGA